MPLWALNGRNEKMYNASLHTEVSAFDSCSVMISVWQYTTTATRSILFTHVF